jgi:hypothetical protein
MPAPAFDAKGAVRFDLPSGAASDVRGTRLILLPAAALDALEPGVLAHLGSELGRGCGARVAARLGGDASVRTTELEAVATHLAGEIAIAGIGALSIERWGRALVLVVDNAGVANDGFIGAALGGALGAATGRDVAIAPLGREGTKARFFVGAEATVRKLGDLLTEGRSWSDALALLQKKEPS